MRSILRILPPLLMLAAASSGCIAPTEISPAAPILDGGAWYPDGATVTGRTTMDQADGQTPVRVYPVPVVVIPVDTFNYLMLTE